MSECIPGARHPGHDIQDGWCPKCGVINGAEEIEELKAEVERLRALCKVVAEEAFAREGRIGPDAALALQAAGRGGKEGGE